MTVALLNPDDQGYLIVAMEPGEPDVQLEACLTTLALQGWTLRLEGFRVRIFAGPRFAWPVVQVHRAHALIGEWRGEGAHPSEIAGRSPDDPTLASELIREGWGAYLMVWRSEGGELNLMRDPSGAIDAVWWKHGRATLVTDRPPAALDAVLPQDLSIDWALLGALLRTPSLLTDAPPLTGLRAVGAGCWTRLGRLIEERELWRPSDLVRRGSDDHPEALVSVVDHTIDRLMALAQAGGLRNFRRAGFGDRRGNFEGDRAHASRRLFELFRRRCGGR